MSVELLGLSEGYLRGHFFFVLSFFELFSSTLKFNFPQSRDKAGVVRSKAGASRYNAGDSE